MRRPIVLMTFGTDVGPHPIRRLTMYRNYAEALKEGGALVLGVTDPDAAEESCALADALLLTGGADVDPVRFGEAAMPKCGKPDAWRDALELAYAKAFLAAKKPILGICRGMQVLNVALGGTLYQDIPTQLGFEHPGGSLHEIEAADGSLLEKLFGKRFTVNSYHHQCVRDLAPGCVVDAVFAEDARVVEAMHHASLPVFAYQFHPERMRGADRLTPEGPDMKPLFDAFLEAVGANMA